MKMKTPLKKLRELGGQKNRKKMEKEKFNTQFDDIACASQDMQDMKECYDSLLSAAAATANSAYEFSESLKEMGACLLEKTALNDDEESGKVLIMLGKLQFELQGLVDKYRSHIFQTITVPSESLLNEIRTVEEMKKQCDEKRSSYENMVTTSQDKKRLRSSKEETAVSSQQVKAARDEYDEEATLFVFRLKSLKQGQSRSLLTQAARHHASQLCFFRKALLSVESVEPHVQKVTEQNHIDYLFSGLEEDINNDDDDDTDYNDYENSSVSDDTDNENGELSFEYRGKEPEGIFVPTPRSSIEEKLNRRSPTDAFALAREQKASSQSAPLSAGKNFDTDKRLRELQSLNSRKFHSYVLPTPTQQKNPPPTRPISLPLEPPRTSLSGIALNYRHSSPLDQLKYSKSMRNDKLAAPIVKERNENATKTNLPPSKSDEMPLPSYDRYAMHNADRVRRQSFSGPLIGMVGTSNPSIYSSDPMASATKPMLYSPPSLKPSSLSPPPRPTSLSPQQSPNASPNIVSSPKISELHELPRPPRHHHVASRPLPPPPQQMLAS